MQAVWKHRSARLVARPAPAPHSRVALPYMFLFQILLPIVAPVIDLFAHYGVLFTDPVRFLAAWAGFNVVQVVIALYAFRLDRESRGRCGRCRCSSSSTASSCTW